MEDGSGAIEGGGGSVGKVGHVGAGRKEVSSQVGYTGACCDGGRELNIRCYLSAGLNGKKQGEGERE